MKQAMNKMNTVIKTAALALTFACTSALADNNYQYLYWYVDETDSGNTYAFAYATLTEGNSGAAIDLRPANSYSESQELGYTAGSGPIGFESDLGTYANSASYFYIELFGEDNVPFAVSTSMTYSQLYAAGYLGNPGTGTQAEHAWKVSAFMVPEPTSGMLFLAGLALLGLRRKVKSEE